MARGVTLTKTAQQATTTVAGAGFKFVVTASAPTGGLPAEVFKFLRRPLNPALPAGAVLDTFVGVCGANDLATLAVGNPYAGSDPAYYRAATVTVTAATPNDGLAAWTAVVAAVATLVTNLDAQDVTGVATSVRVGSLT